MWFHLSYDKSFGVSNINAQHYSHEVGGGGGGGVLVPTGIILSICLSACVQFCVNSIPSESLNIFGSNWVCVCIIMSQNVLQKDRLPTSRSRFLLELRCLENEFCGQI